MKKVLEKIKAFFRRLKTAFLTALNDLKARLKQLQIKSTAKQENSPKKHKNASKWLFIVLVVFLLFNPSVSCRQKTTANAFPITGNYLLSTPCITVAQVSSNGVFYDNVTIPPFYLSFVGDDGLPNVDKFYYIGGNSGDLGYNSVDVSSGSATISSMPLLVGDSTTPNNLLWSQIPVDIIIKPKKLLIQGWLNLIVEVEQRFVWANLESNSYDCLRYDWKALDGDILLTVDVVVGKPSNFGFQFPRFYNDDFDRPLEYYSTTITAYSYRPPLTTNEEYYYLVGLNEGKMLGLEQGISDNFTPLGSIFNTVDRFLDIELFNGFKISTLLYIGFGLLLVGFIIKVFLGG